MKWLVSVDRAQPAAARRYCSWVERLDIVAVPVSPADRISQLELFDALLLTGGGDIHPDYYGQAHHATTDGVDSRRDRFEMDLVVEFVKARKPVFGICRGIQLINVAFRGTLIQDVPEWLALTKGVEERHHRIGNQDARHAVRWVNSTELAAVLGQVDEVNSAHHQAVAPDGLGTNLRVAAESPAGVIEAVESVGTGSPVIAVQWHPERLPFEHPASQILLRYWQERAAAARVSVIPVRRRS